MRMMVVFLSSNLTTGVPVEGGRYAYADTVR